MNQSKRLAGKVAIVTGTASRGPRHRQSDSLTLFAREGAKVLLVNRTEPRMTELQHQIIQQGGTSSICLADVTDPDQVEKMVDIDH